MPEIGALLHDAVPPDGSEPDLGEIAHRAGRRRRHRRLTRVALPVAALATLAAVVLTVERGADDERGNAVATDGSTTTTETTAPSGPSSVARFAALLGDRPVLATADRSAWPAAPADFFDLEPPDQVVVGRLAAVRPGTMTPALCEEVVVSGCVQNLNLETVVDVERWLGPDDRGGATVAVPWILSTTGPYGGGPQDEQLAALASQPYEDRAPIGARVLVFLRADPLNTAYPWAPAAVSGIVIEDGEGVALPVGSASPATAHRDTDFDDYVTEVEALLR
jgi:hypothetical protein